MAGAGKAVERVVAVLVLARFAVDAEGVVFQIVGGGPLQDSGLAWGFDLLADQSSVAVPGFGFTGTTGVEGGLREVPPALVDVQAGVIREVDGVELALFPGVGERVAVGPGLAGFLAVAVPGAGLGDGLAAECEGFAGFAAQRVEGVAGTIGEVVAVAAIAVAGAGELAGGVPGVGDGATGRAAAGRGVGFLGAPAGVVVAVGDFVALGVGDIGELAEGVVGVGGGLAQGADFARAPVVGVVGVAGGAASGVGDGNEVVGAVPGVAGDAA